MKRKSKKLKLLAGVTAISLCSTLIASSSYSASANPLWNRFKAIFTRTNSSANISSKNSNLNKPKNDVGCFDRMRNFFTSSSSKNIDGKPRNHKKRANIDKNDIVVVVNNDPEMNKLHTVDFKKKVGKQLDKDKGKKGALYRVLRVKNNDPERNIINRLFINHMDVDDSNNTEGATGGWGISKTNLGMPVYQNIDADGEPIGDRPSGSYPVTNIHTTPAKSGDDGDKVVYASLKFKKTGDSNKPHDKKDKVIYAKIKKQPEKGSDDKVVYAQLDLDKPNDPTKIHGGDDKVIYAKIRKRPEKGSDDKVVYAQLDLDKPSDPTKIHGGDDKVIYAKIRKNVKKGDPVYQNIDADGKPIGDRPYGTFPITTEHVSPDPKRDKKPGRVEYSQLKDLKTTSTDKKDTTEPIDYERLGAKPKTRKPVVTPRTSVAKKSKDKDRKPVATPRTSVVKKSTDDDKSKKPVVAPKPVVIKTSTDKPENKETMVSRKTIFIKGSTDKDKKPETAPKPKVTIKTSTDSSKDKKPAVAPKPVVIKTPTDKPENKETMVSRKTIFIKGSTDKDKKPETAPKPKFTIKTSADSSKDKKPETAPKPILIRKTNDDENGVTSGSVKDKIKIFENNGKNN